MSAIRLAIQLPAEAGGSVVEAATAADRLGLDALWVGAISGAPEPSAATTTLLAAIAARTEDVRLCAVLGAGDEFEHVHVAEELGVLDQASGGRVELVVRAETVARCGEFCDSVYQAWDGIELPDGRVVRVTPTPQQPVLPTSLLPSGEDHRSPRGRVEILDPVPGWVQVPGEGAPADAAALARRLAAERVYELVVPLRPGRELVPTIIALATVVRPVLASSSHELDLVAEDAVRWHAETAVGIS